MEMLWIDSCVFREIGVLAWGKTYVQISNEIIIFSYFTDDNLYLNLAVFFLVLNSLVIIPCFSLTLRFYPEV